MRLRRIAALSVRRFPSPLQDGHQLDTAPLVRILCRRMRPAQNTQHILRRDVFPIVLLIAAIVLAVDYADKAADNRSAFVRWRPQIQALVRGENVYLPSFTHPGRVLESADPESAYPNPPLLAIALYPLTLLPPVVGAVIVFAIKVAMTWWLFAWSIRLASGSGLHLPFLPLVVLFVVTIRPIVSDLNHGNVNIIIAFLVLASLWLFALRRDVWAGLIMALATTFKVTPALFIPYFMWKRQWTFVIASLAGLVLFLLIAPSLVLGPMRNAELLRDWYRAMLRPYIVNAYVETRQHNQSMPGLVHRWLTPSEGIELKDQPPEPVNVASLTSQQAQWIVRVLSLSVLVALAWLCRTKTNDRRDWRLACEYGLIVLAMLIVSERSWKHHYTTFVLPIACIAAHWGLRAQGRMKTALPIVLAVVWVLMSTTSSELGGWLAPDRQGHKYAQAAGGFLWAAVVTFITLAVILRQNQPVPHVAPAPNAETSAARIPQSAAL